MEINFAKCKRIVVYWNIQVCHTRVMWKGNFFFFVLYTGTKSKAVYSKPSMHLKVNITLNTLFTVIRAWWVSFEENTYEWAFHNRSKLSQFSICHIHSFSHCFATCSLYTLHGAQLAKTWPAAMGACENQQAVWGTSLGVTLSLWVTRCYSAGERLHLKMVSSAARCP